MKTSLACGFAESPRRLLLLAVMALTTAVTSLTSCKALTEAPASLSNYSDSATIYALNGAPSGAPTALYIYGGTILSANSSFTFDIAFDLTDTGIAILPLRAVASGLVSTHSVALATVSDTFGAVKGVPKGTLFRADTAMIAVVNQVVLVRVDASGSVCASSATGSYVYGKVVVRSVDRTARTLRIDLAVDPNCGFRSFESGLPTYILRPVHRGAS